MKYKIGDRFIHKYRVDEFCMIIELPLEDMLLGSTRDACVTCYFISSSPTTRELIKETLLDACYNHIPTKTIIDSIRRRIYEI